MEAIASILAIVMPAAKIAGLSIEQWLKIIGVFETLEPTLKTLLIDAEPAFASIDGELKQGLSHAQIAQNRISEIPGYGSDGGVTEIPAPA